MFSVDINVGKNTLLGVTVNTVSMKESAWHSQVSTVELSNESFKMILAMFPHLLSMKEIPNNIQHYFFVPSEPFAPMFPL